jgi:glycosyltransferase involved in cell wall biosynthesis
MAAKTIFCTVTNDLIQDQRMHRICNSLSNIGYEVILVGRLKKQSKEILDMPFTQRRISCFFERGILFYAEYNIRLLFLLLTRRWDIVYSVDTDTLLAGSMAKILKRRKQIFDAHEYFTEVPELKGKTLVKAFWSFVEGLCIPHTDIRLTVNESLTKIFTHQFKKEFHTIYNVPVSTPTSIRPTDTKKYLLYQGVLNAGRGLEVLMEAMPKIPDIDLVLAGEGDLSEKLRQMAAESPASDRIIFTGWQTPKALKKLTNGAVLGLNLLDGESKSYYYSLANKFFDYMLAGVPSINMDFPEYRNIISHFEIGILISSFDVNDIATAINRLLSDQTLYLAMQKNCINAKDVYNWKNEEGKLKALVSALH